MNILYMHSYLFYCMHVLQTSHNFANCTLIMLAFALYTYIPMPLITRKKDLWLNLPAPVSPRRRSAHVSTRWNRGPGRRCSYPADCSPRCPWASCWTGQAGRSPPVETSCPLKIPYSFFAHHFPQYLQKKLFCFIVNLNRIFNII